MAVFSRESSLVSALRSLDYIFRSRGIVLSQFRSKSIQSPQCAYKWRPFDHVAIVHQPLTALEQ